MFLVERTAFPMVLTILYLVFLGLNIRAVSRALRSSVRRSNVPVQKLDLLNGFIQRWREPYRV
jgi:hypothetical protein